MKKLFTAFFVISFLLFGLISATEVLNIDKTKYTKLPGFLGYKANEFIVVLKDNVAVDHARDMASDLALNHIPEFAGLARRFNAEHVRPQFIGADRSPRASTPEGRALARHYKVRIPEGLIDEAIEAYSKLPFVERVEKIGIHTVCATPNDTYYDDPPPEFPYDQWHYWDTYGINADSAWDKETGAQTVIVGDLDIGTMYDHGDLGGSDPPGPDDAVTNGNIWINTNEIPGNSVDDDGNGYIDDIIGWDFVERTDWYSYACIDIDCGGADNDPSDGEGHGTHTAGTIAAITNNGYAVAGVAGGYGNGTFAGGGNGVKVVPCRIGYVLDYWIYGPTGVVIMDYVAEAMYYMAELKISGWNVASINCSFGNTNSGGLAGAADYLIAQDVVICVSAGNGNSTSPSYLGSRGDCLDVGATDKNGNPASFSNYGSWVDIAAPGVEVLSTITDPADPGVDYIAAMDGTSMSSPHLAGVVALLESYAPSLSATDKINIITDVANTRPYNQTKYVGVGIVDARKCLDAAQTCDLNADFSGTPTSGCAPLAVSFTDLSTGTAIDGWSWTFGDGGSSTAQNPNYTYNNPGTYTVSLTVSSSSQGCDDTETKTAYITVNGAPVADFEGNPTSGTEPLTVNFTDLSTGSPGSWDWNFGDGGTSTEQNPSHTYTSDGTYTVTLTATNNCGSYVEQKVDYITVDPCVAPIADFSGSPVSGEAPLTVDFTDLSTGNPTSWDWNFGDGGTSTEQNPSHTYTSQGTYMVTLTAANVCGSDVEQKVDYITVTEPQFQKAYALSDIPVIGTVSGSFANTHASDDSYEVITEVEYTGHPRKRYSYLEHKWNFNVDATGDVNFYVEAYRPGNTDGDNFIFAYSLDDVTYNNLVTVNSSTEQIYSASLPGALSGTVYISVIDIDRSWGNTSLDPVYVDYMYVEFTSTPQPPVAEFSGTPRSGDYPLTVSFTDLSTGSPDTWSWIFGDGGTSTDQNPSHTYTAAGTYTVELTASNAQGSDTETKFDYITVTEPGSTYMYVYAMVVGRAKSGPNYFGTCTVTIYNNSSQPVSGATVYITATGPTSGSYSGVTAADGTVYFEAPPMKKPSGEWCFEVTNVTHATYPYDSDYNNATKSCESGDVFKVFGNVTPSHFEISNYPNPFNPTTTFRFALPETAFVTLNIYNITGQQIATLVDRQLEVGYHTCEWDASNFASGIYFYQIKAGMHFETKKILLLK